MTAETASRAVLARQNWRLIQADQQAARAAWIERWVVGFSGLLLVLMLLYVLIGNKPYVHEVALDPLTGATEMSPINRYIWLLLGAISVPVLWMRRASLPGAALRLWPLILLLGWFALTTRWALDPAASNRRLLLYGINAVVCIAVATGLRTLQRTHRAMAIACAIVILIDLFSWIFMPGRSMTELGLAAIHSHKNTLGAVMLLSGFICGAYAWGQSGWRGRLFWWSMTAFAVALLLASQSKTSIGIFFCLAAATPLLLLLLSQRPVVILSAVSLGAMTLLSGVFGWLAWCELSGLDPLTPFRGVTFTQRTDVWAFVYQQFTLQPVKGWGFGSFWDVDPRVQPSLQTDYWFSRPDAFTNEAHNGYLDLAATTGLVGLIGALFLLGRWMSRGLIHIRQEALSVGYQGHGALAAATVMGVFPLLFFGHNWMESSYFTANALFGTIILVIGTSLDLSVMPSRARSAA